MSTFRCPVCERTLARPSTELAPSHRYGPPPHTVAPFPHEMLILQVSGGTGASARQTFICPVCTQRLFDLLRPPAVGPTLSST